MRTSIAKLTDRLATKFDDPVLCTQYACWILHAITGKSEVQLAISGELTLTHTQQDQLDEWLEQLLERDKPLQYILGAVPFGDVDIRVRPPVLIPRPETEEWCMALIAKLNFLDNKNLTIIDLCCGSGCIAIALARALPFARVIAVDIADEAVALTRENARHNDITITVVKGDLFTQISPDIRADLVVANPPYISQKDYLLLDRSVLEWEDRRALVPDEEGLSIIKKIICHAPEWIQPNDELALHELPQLMIEIGHDQAPAVVALMKAADYTAITVHKDLAGKDRVVSGRVGVSHGTQKI